ncbi:MULTISPECIES: type II toxin-antitoxin system HigB family toxin [Nostoc]|uniref:Type II toxin-antitoxin system HigB family toxin n=1 Tax=Nostoc paludosum FACHB-159 TaxID=2692908 RepID=A0ABR8K6P7_9NOSO|nr:MULTISPECIES: type II toxin-antitoxin system HigB family toxin [Nostoc]MBD2676690.1 type II toxin-antitoxin system HigB family toxin [Nostoc sp. FACHB-857]MBD2735169.1 type II toxin-antitoxin system HigB family toxin [Nostoc paludosum FACHB-159]
MVEAIFKSCLILSINYQKQVIYIKYVLTHAEYDKDN